MNVWFCIMKSLHEQKMVSYIRQPSSNNVQHATKASYTWTDRAKMNMSLAELMTMTF